MSDLVRSFTLPLKDLVAVKDYEKIDSFLSSMDQRFKEILSDDDFMRDAEILRQQGHKGYFWQKIAKIHSPHLSWPREGNRAKFYRMMLTQVFETYRSLEERQELGRICESLDWNESKTDEVRGLCTEKRLYPTNGQIRNVLRYGKIPEFPRNLDFVLDYRQGDSQVVKQEGSIFTIQVGSEWIVLPVHLPKYLRGVPKKLSKPKIYRKEDRLLIDFAYWTAPYSEENGDGNLGIDLGKIKNFAGAAVYTDGSWTHEKTGSKEAERLADKVKVLSCELNSISRKMNKIETLLKGKEDLYLAQHFLDLEVQRKSLSFKRLKIKEHLSWVLARDIVHQAIENDCSSIHLEDLRWLDSKGGKWDHSSIQQKVSQIAELYGISVEKVDARNSSHTDPFTGNYSSPNRKRELPLSDGSLLDRDYAAALELAYRNPKKLKVKSPRPKKEKCRTKTGPTSKRPKSPSRRKLRLLDRKAGHSSFVSASVESQDKDPLSSNLIALTSEVVDTESKYHGFR